MGKSASEKKQALRARGVHILTVRLEPDASEHLKRTQREWQKRERRPISLNEVMVRKLMAAS
jgi:hypothetical protein